MNFREEILKEHSKKQTLKVANYVGADKKLFAEIMHLFFANEYQRFRYWLARVGLFYCQ